MATTKSVYPDTAQIVSNAKAGTFIPEIWSDEVIAAYKSNLVLANQVKKLGMTGKLNGVPLFVAQDDEDDDAATFIDYDIILSSP